MFKKYCSCKCADLGLIFLRIAVGVPFLVHGIMKLQNIDGTAGFFSSMGFPAFFAWLVALIETIGGAFILLGLFTQVSATLLAIIMLVAIVKAKASKWYLGAELEFILLFASLALASVGPGRFAVRSYKCMCGGGCGSNCADKKDGKKEGCCGGGCC